MPCTKCRKTIYGTRWISGETTDSYCGECYESTELYETEDVWFMRSSIFHGAPANGPAIARPTLADMPKDEKPKVAEPARPTASFGFGAPRAQPPPARVHVHVPGENYNDYLSTEDKKPEETKTTEPESFADASIESYSESMAVDLKRTNTYSYTDDDTASDTTGGYSDDTSSNVAHVTITSPASYNNNSIAYSTSSGGYTDDSTTGGYADDAPSTAAYTDSSATDTATIGYSDDSTTATANTGGYTDDDATPGYTDDSSVATSKAAYISSATTGGYTDDGSDATVGYTDDSSTTTGGYSDDSPAPVQNTARVSIAPPSRAPTAAPSYSSGGYTDDDSSASVGYTGDSSTGGYTDDSNSAASTAASTAAYTDDSSAQSTAAYTDDSATAAYSDTATTGGYSDDSGSGAAYVDTSSSTGPSSTAATTASYTDSAAYTDSSAGYTGGSASSGAGYADDTPSSAAGYSNDSQSGGYSDDSQSAGYSESTGYAVADPFRAAASKSTQATYAGSNPASYSTGSEAGYSGNDSVGYGSGASDISGYNAAQPAPAAQPRPAPPKPAADGSRDWNEEFQQSITDFRQNLRNESQTSTIVLQSCHDLYKLSLDFIATAQEIGRTIIEEVSIPAPAKSIKPANVGGIAGGEKYVVKGIFFKFAIDAFGVYGGDEFAQKAAGHELAGLKAYYNCAIEGLNTPFMLLMDYRGYRLIATTKLPLSGASLIYGSADGGITVHKDDGVMNEMMKKAASQLNIKPHVVGMRNQTDTLYAPTDIEGHKGGDGRYYVLDTARICPPEPVHKSFTAVVLPPEDPFPAQLTKFKLYDMPKQARAKTGEFWTPWPPLREVGLTTERWLDQIYAHLGIINNGTVTAASEEFGEGLLYHIKEENMLAAQTIGRDGPNRAVNVRASNLVGKVIHGPALLVLRGRKGAQLFNLLRYETVKRNEVALSSDAFTPFGKHSRDLHNEEVENCFYDILAKTIPEFLNTARLFPHAAGALKAIQLAGINTRMIGFLRSSVQDSTLNAAQLRAWLLNEMIVRVTKNYLRSKLRRATLKLKPIEPIIIKRFNLLLGASTSTSFFWSTEMKAQIVNKFGRNGQALTPTELKTESDLRSSVNKLALFQLLQSKIGVVFTEEANGRFQVDPRRFEVPHPLNEKDLSKLTVLQKSLLQPELDELILRAAVKASNNNPEKMLELSGQYLPQASSHPAIALQRLHIAEKLLMEITDRLGMKFATNFLYTSNVDNVVHISESTPDYLRSSKAAPLNQRFDGSAFLQNEALIDFLQTMPEYNEVLSHMEVLRLWVESTPYCPLEITCKLFYLRGCLAFVHRLWTTAEAFLKTSYDIITRVTNVPTSAAELTYAQGYVRADNDRPFSLLILDRLVRVLLIQDRHMEALAFSEKFVRQLTDSSFPGTASELLPLFGSQMPIAFSIYRTVAGARDHVRNVLDPFEKELMKDRMVKTDELADWKSRVLVTNFSELSGFFMSTNVFQQYLDEKAYRQSTAFPYMNGGVIPWGAVSQSRDTGQQQKIDTAIHAPPALVASPEPRDLRVQYWVHPNRFLYPDLPVRMAILADTDFIELTKLDLGQRFVAQKEKIVAEMVIHDCQTNYRGTMTFKDLVLNRPGPHMCMILDGKNRMLSNVGALASQVIQVIAPETSASPMIFGHDICSNYWSLLRSLPTDKIDSISISDSDYENFDSTMSASNVILQDTAGKLWSSTEHNWIGQPISLLRNNNSGEGTFAPHWGIMADLMAWKVKKVAVSFGHTLVLTDNGEVLSMGQNTRGELGHGDTVPQSDPRLVRRLKGKQVTNIFAAEDCSAAVDAFGTLYQFGLGFTNLPEPHPFFSGKSASSKGKTIGIASVNFQAFRVGSKNEERRKTESYRKFFESQPMVYLSITGEAYIWAPNEKFFGKDHEPDRVTMPNEPIVDVIVCSNSIAFLTHSGAVYTAGSNQHGELGHGFGTVNIEMPKGAFHADVPYGCAQKIPSLSNYKIIALRAAQEKLFALSDMGEYFEWGGRAAWYPQTPPAVLGLRVTRIDAGLRCIAVSVDQKATLPLPPNPLAIEIGFQLEAAEAAESAALASSGGDGAIVSATPKAEIAGTVFAIDYVELPNQPDFELHIRIPKTMLGEYYLRIVKPGETEKFMEVFSAETNLHMRDHFESVVSGLYSAAVWGTPTASRFNPTRPPMKAGDYEALIISKGNSGHNFEDTTIHYRSPKFSIRARNDVVSLKVTPERPVPQSKVTFEIHPQPTVVPSYFYICIRPVSNPDMCYGVVTVEANKELTWDAMMNGKYIASYEYTTNPSGPGLDVYATAPFTVGPPESEMTEIQLEATPEGPYHCGQSVVLEWKFTKNPPKAGVTVYGGAYKASDTGMAAMMQGAYASVAAAEGIATITLPMLVDEFEYRVQMVVPGSGIEKIGSLPLNIIAQTSSELSEKLKALNPPPPVVEAPAAADPSVDGVPSSSSLVPGTGSAGVTSGSSGSSGAFGAADSTPVVSTFENWNDFFTACGIDKGFAAAYSKLCKNVSVAKIPLLDGGVLITLKIIDVEHQLAILAKIDQIRRAEMKAWITHQMANYASGMSPSLD